MLSPVGHRMAARTPGIMSPFQAGGKRTDQVQKMFPKPHPEIPLTFSWPALSHVPTHMATEPEESRFIQT